MKPRSTRSVLLFVVCLLLAGLCYLFSRLQEPFVNSLLFCGNFTIYAGLLLFWMQSVQARLLPTRARRYIVAAAILMLLYLALRVFKYRISGVAPVPTRYAVYAYWIPQMLIPALFLMTCLCIRRGEASQRRGELLLIPACALSVLAMTNDLHALIYAPKVPLSEFAVATGT